jgi:hypothetical protein
VTAPMLSICVAWNRQHSQEEQWRPSSAPTPPVVIQHRMQRHMSEISVPVVDLSCLVARQYATRTSTPGRQSGSPQGYALLVGGVDGKAELHIVNFLSI